MRISLGLAGDGGDGDEAHFCRYAHRSPAVRTGLRIDPEHLERRSRADTKLRPQQRRACGACYLLRLDQSRVFLLGQRRPLGNTIRLCDCANRHGSRSRWPDLLEEAGSSGGVGLGPAGFTDYDRADLHSGNMHSWDYEPQPGLVLYRELALGVLPEHTVLGLGAVALKPVRRLRRVQHQGIHSSGCQQLAWAAPPLLQECSAGELPRPVSVLLSRHSGDWALVPVGSADGEPYVGLKPRFVDGTIRALSNDCNPTCAAGSPIEVMWRFVDGPLVQG